MIWKEVQACVRDILDASLELSEMLANVVANSD